MLERWLELQGLTDAELAANRSGRLGPRQEREMREQVAKQQRGARLMSVIGGFTVITALAIGAWWVHPLVFAVPVAVVAYAWMYGFLPRTLQKRLEQDLDAGAVSAVVGRVEDAGASWVIVANRFYTGWPRFRSLRPELAKGTPVCLWVLASRRRVVAIEPSG